ncbi:MAG: hypothetical protein COC06_09575 [Bacteroidales bacterium]|nr:MAG: hypothetical protein COC06_09575 [Bacteroidales bacterium]
MNKKKFFFDICCLTNILFAISIIAIPLLFIFYAKDLPMRNNISEKLGSDIGTLITYFFGITHLLLLGFLVINWKRRKDKLRYLLLVLCLNVFYTPFYYLRIRRDITD